MQDKVFNLRLSGVDLRTIGVKAADHGVSRSEYVRIMALNGPAALDELINLQLLACQILLNDDAVLAYVSGFVAARDKFMTLDRYVSGADARLLAELFSQEFEVSAKAWQSVKPTSRMVFALARALGDYLVSLEN